MDVLLTELSPSEKYVDAFWRLAPVPALVVADAAALTLHPSRSGFVAVAVVAVVGASIEGPPLTATPSPMESRPSS